MGSLANYVSSSPPSLSLHVWYQVPPPRGINPKRASRERLVGWHSLFCEAVPVVVWFNVSSCTCGLHCVSILLPLGHAAPDALANLDITRRRQRLVN